MSVIGITGSTDGTGAASRWAPRPASRTHSGAEELAAKALGGDVALVVGEPGCPNPVAQLVSPLRRARPSRPIRHTGYSRWPSRLSARVHPDAIVAAIRYHPNLKPLV